MIHYMIVRIVRLSYHYTNGHMFCSKPMLYDVDILRWLLISSLLLLAVKSGSVDLDKKKSMSGV